MSRTRPLRTAMVAVALTAVGGLLLAPAATAAPPLLEEIRTFTVDSPRATGYALDLDGDLAAYTGSYASNSAAGTGQVQVAERSGPAATDWAVSDLPVPADARGYGAAVAVDAVRDRVVVGALTSQQVVVYERDGAGGWQVERILTPPADARVGLVRSFGEALALDGDTLVIGAPNSTVDGRANAGLAYVADLGTGAITPMPPQPELVVAQGIAGQAVAVSDGTIAVGAPQITAPLDFYGGTYRVGGVYLWDAGDLAAGASLTTQPVGEELKAVPPVAIGGGPAFGYTLAFVGARLYVGSPLEVNYTADDPSDPLGGYNAGSIDEGTTTQGAVYVYDASDPAAPHRIGGKLMPPAHSWGFGYQIAATGDALMASAYHTADDGLGEVYVLDPNAVDPAVPDDGGLLRQTVAPAQMLRGSDMEPGAQFGSSVIGGGMALSGERAIVGAFATGSSAGGKVYLFEPVRAALPVVSVPDVTVTYGQPASLTAAVTGAGADASVAVLVDGTEVPGATIADGVVSLVLDPAAHPVGQYPVTVELRATGEVLASGAGTLTVDPAATTTTLAVGGLAVAGTELPVRGIVTAEYGTAPTGTVDVLVGGTVVARGDVGADGQYTARVPAEHVVTGPLALETRYAGDGNHLASAATTELTIPEPVAPEPTPTPTPGPGPGPGPGGPGTSEPGPDAGDRGALAVTGPSVAALLGLVAALTAIGTALIRRRAAA